MESELFPLFLFTVGNQHFSSSQFTGHALDKASALDSRKHKLSPQESKEGKLPYKSFETVSSAPPATAGEKTAGYRVLPTLDSTSSQNLLSKSRKKCG